MDLRPDLPDPPEPGSFGDSPLSRALAQPLMLGLFLPIQSGGWSPSLEPRSTTWTFDYNAELTLRAEALGFDLVFGLAEWVRHGGYGGVSRFREESLDPFITATALAALTKRIILISTIHILYGPWHPLHLAKFGATLDHIAGGRWGVNVVTGYAPREPVMFGMQKVEHDLRYRMADEFTTILKKLWRSSENVSLSGAYWQLEDAFARPQPRFGRPILVSATGSPAGFDYAGRHSDIAFITSPAGAKLENALPALPDHIAAIKAAGRKHGRDLRTLINPMIVCRDTDAEAWDYYDRIVRNADQGAVDGYARHHALADSKAWKNHRPQDRILGGNIHIIGGPDYVTEQLANLKSAGCDGLQISFYDFQPDLDFFGKRVLPLMRQAGLRN
ncbi:LLM class flavin-dependent oxidoreductase [Methylobacterium sp. HMF5984]|uniref:LLM class flavin-dependent oxidoreductase n=1 Tax=Methylobacterium sp. HMF5984 TaxID=3367370 RepID=UPI003853547B